MMDNDTVEQSPGMQLGKPKKKWKIVLLGIAIVSALVIAVLGGVAAWYYSQLQPVDMNTKQQQKVVIEPGSDPQLIADQLHEEGVIRSSMAFAWYVRLNGVQGKLQAGTYRLGKNMSVAAIVDHLASGKTDMFTITFYPGATLIDPTSKPEAQKTDVTTVLLRAGYSQKEIDEALSATYDHPLFATKPARASLEGYIYGETYQMSSSATVKEILNYSFDEMYKTIEQENLVKKFKAQGLTLYEGITLASIVQREVNEPEDQKQVAGVFFNRMKKGMNLGSDVTYQYIADKTGQERDPALKSPYNTRINTGLPPGPIASPGKSALIAVGNPEKSEYLFFLSGDDDKTYFGRNDTEHEQNKVKYCQEKCQIF